MACCGPADGVRDNDDWRYPRHVEWKRLVGGEDVPLVLAPSYDRPLLPSTTVEVPNPLHTRSAQQWFTNLPDDTARSIMNARRGMLREQQIVDAVLTMSPKPSARDPRPTADMVMRHMEAMRAYRAALAGRGRGRGRGPGGIGQRPGTAPPAPGGTQAVHRMGVQLGVSQPSTPRVGGPMLQPEPNGLPPPVMQIIAAQQQQQQQQQQQPQQQAGQPGAQPPQGKFASMLRSISPFKGAAPQSPQAAGQQPPQQQPGDPGAGAGGQASPPGPWYKRVFRRGSAPAAAAAPGAAGALPAPPPPPPPGQAPPAGPLPMQPQAQQAPQPGGPMPPQAPWPGQMPLQPLSPLQPPAAQLPPPGALSPDQQLIMRQMAAQMATQAQLQQSLAAAAAAQAGQLGPQAGVAAAAPSFSSVRPALGPQYPQFGQAPLPSPRPPPQQGYGAAPASPYGVQQGAQPYGSAPYGAAGAIAGGPPYGSVQSYQQQQLRQPEAGGMAGLQQPYPGPPASPPLQPPPPPLQPPQPLLQPPAPPLGMAPLPPPPAPLPPSLQPPRNGAGAGFGLAEEIQSGSTTQLAPLPLPPSPRGTPPPAPWSSPPAPQLGLGGGSYGLGADVAEAEAGLGSPFPPPAASPPPLLLPPQQQPGGTHARAVQRGLPPVPFGSQQQLQQQQQQLDPFGDALGGREAMGAGPSALPQMGLPPPGLKLGPPLPPPPAPAPGPPGPRRLQRAPSDDDAAVVGGMANLDDEYGLGAEVDAATGAAVQQPLHPGGTPGAAAAGGDFGDTFSFGAREGFGANAGATPQKLRPIGRPSPVALPASRFAAGDDLEEEEF